MSLDCRNKRKSGLKSHWAVSRVWFTFVMVAAAALAAPVTYDRILHSDKEPHNWFTYSGDYASRRYSELTQINSKTTSRNCR